MKKLILLCAMLLVITTSAAYAGGLRLRWNNCEGEGGVQNINFACNTNTGSRALAASVTLDTDLLAVLSDELVVDIVTAGASLAPWWQLRTSLTLIACRDLSISILAQDGASCPDVFSLMGSMNIAGMQPFTFGPNSIRLLSVNAVPVASPVNLLLVDGAERGVARWTISNARTVGSPSCAGCSLGACIVFSSCNLATVGNLNNRLITGPAAPGSDFVTWQGGAGTDCPAATPTKNATWGTVKSLYR